MSIPAYTGQSLNLAQIATEFGGATPHALGEYYASAGYVPTGTTGVPPGSTTTLIPSSGVIKIGNFYGSVALTYPITMAYPGAGDGWFGRGVAIGGNFAVVGAPHDDTTGTDSGRVYVYDVTTGALVRTIADPTPGANDLLGYSLGIDGNNIVVGAYGDSISTTNNGTAYVFNATTGALISTLHNPSPVIHDYFGVDVDISGNYAVVGKPQSYDPDYQSGSVYVFNATTGALLRTLHNPAPAAQQVFGTAVAITGTNAAIGATGYNGDAGIAYVIDVTSGVTVCTLNNPTPVALDQFGNSIAIDGNNVVVGAFNDDTGAGDSGSVYVFNATTGALIRTISNPSPNASDWFGFDVSLSGNYVIIGAKQDDTSGSNSGIAYVFDITTGALIQTIANPNPTANDQFGISVGIDGDNIIIGAHLDDATGVDSGNAYLYKVAP